MMVVLADEVHFRNQEESMEFSVGDKVMHPKFGAGKITREEHRELVKGFEHYFVIEIFATGATAYVPIRKMADLSVRMAMSWSKLDQVLGTLRSLPSILSNDYRLRQEQLQEKLGTRLPLLMAEAVRDLTWHRKHKRLTQKDETLLNRGRELLATEIALATDTRTCDAQEMIDAALTVALASRLDELEDTQRPELTPAPSLTGLSSAA
jgi:CarD family transcriptional regulator